MLKKLRPREHVTWRTNQQLEQPELTGCQFDAFLATLDIPRDEIDRQISRLQHTELLARIAPHHSV